MGDSVVDAVFAAHYAQREAQTDVWGGKMAAKIKNDDVWGLVERLIVYYDAYAKYRPLMNEKSAESTRLEGEVDDAWTKVKNFVSRHSAVGGALAKKYPHIGDIVGRDAEAWAKAVHNDIAAGRLVVPGARGRRGRAFAHWVLEAYK